MDYATFVGIGTVLVLVLACLLAGASGDLGAFWSLPSLLLVLGGAAAATLSSYARRQLRGVGGVIRQAFAEPDEAPESVIAELVELADVARREGLLAIDAKLPADDNRFLARALRMVIDGYEPSTILTVLNDEIEATDARHSSGRQLFELLARYCPAFGMLGTVIGLVVMLRGMNDPARIGPGMAVALLTTLYGLVLANGVFHPLAQKLANRSAGELLTKTIVFKGVLAIQQGDNPRVVEQKLRAFLPSAEWRPPAGSVEASLREAIGDEEALSVSGSAAA